MFPSLQGKHILLGVSGGIAAYKSVVLLRDLQKAGAQVRVVMTPAAQQFIGKETFAALSRHEVGVEVFDTEKTESSWVKHIHLAEWADIFVVAPCTANTLSKIVHGLADNLLTNLAQAIRCPMLLCPTMDGEMYGAAAISRNLELARSFGIHLLDPSEGYLASGLHAKGRLPEPLEIMRKIGDLLISVEPNLSGKRILVTAGPTREHIDAVRFVSNPSTGKMGVALAEAAMARGAEVTLIHGPISISPPDCDTIAITSAAELFAQVKSHLEDADVLIMSAAVSDFRAKSPQKHKVKKDKAELSVDLEPTQDILKWVGQHRKKEQLIIGFAMETEDLLENARKKLNDKNADWIIANSLTENEAGFASDTNHVFMISSEKELEFQGSKKELGFKILDALFAKE